MSSFELPCEIYVHARQAGLPVVDIVECLVEKYPVALNVGPGGLLLLLTTLTQGNRNQSPIREFGDLADYWNSGTLGIV